MIKRLIFDLDSIGLHKPPECVIIGDDLQLDIIGAKKNGINTIYVNSRNISQGNVRTASVQNVTQINEHLINSLDVDFFDR